MDSTLRSCRKQADSRRPPPPGDPRLTSRERRIISFAARQWLDGRPWCFLPHFDFWVLDLRSGRATLNVIRAVGMDDGELRRHPERLIEKWEPRK